MTKAVDTVPKDSEPKDSVSKDRVWDIPTRVFHWFIVALFLFLILTGEQGDWLERHMQAGYLLSGLIIFRLLWGFLGSYHARFWNFLRSPWHTLRYAWQLVRGNAEHYQGHNPAGGLMVAVLLLGLLVQAMTGLVTTDDIFWEGPFYSSVPDSVAETGATIHRSLQAFLQLFVIAHILAVIYHKLRFKEPLVSAMFHGYKPAGGIDTGKYDGISTPKLIVSLIIVAAWLAWLYSKPL